jgi:hypothetical protein
MISSNLTPTYRGPQRTAQGTFNSMARPNNGNPGGVNNTSFGDAYINPEGRSGAMAPTFSDYAIRNGGQRPELARYVAPQLDGNGNPVRRDQGGYAYNLPNAAGPFPGYNNFGQGPRYQSPFSRMYNQSPGYGGMMFSQQSPQPRRDQDAYYLELMRQANGLPPSGIKPTAPNMKPMPITGQTQPAIAINKPYFVPNSKEPYGTNPGYVDQPYNPLGA